MIYFDLVFVGILQFFYKYLKKFGRKKSDFFLVKRKKSDLKVETI